jgi:hypothetical protein
MSGIYKKYLVMEKGKRSFRLHTPENKKHQAGVCNALLQAYSIFGFSRISLTTSYC